MLKQAWQCTQVVNLVLPWLIFKFLFQIFYSWISYLFEFVSWRCLSIKLIMFEFKIFVKNLILFELLQTSGVNFINILCAAFMRADLKSAKKYRQPVCIFYVLRSARVKAVHIMLMKIYPWCSNFWYILANENFIEQLRKVFHLAW